MCPGVEGAGVHPNTQSALNSYCLRCRLLRFRVLGQPPEPRRISHQKLNCLAHHNKRGSLGAEDKRQPPHHSLKQNRPSSFIGGLLARLLCFSETRLPEAWRASSPKSARHPQPHSPGTVLGTVPPPDVSSRPPGRDRLQLAYGGHSC